MTTADKDVFKLTIYMTSEQWDHFSKWSAPLVVGGHTPWLHLEHETGKAKEYDDVVNDHLQRLHTHGIIAEHPPITQNA